MVVVHAERVDGRGDHLEVAGADHVAEPEVPDIRHQVAAGVVAVEDRVEEDPVELAVDAAGGVEVTRARWVDRLGIVCVMPSSSDASRSRSAW